MYKVIVSSIAIGSLVIGMIAPVYAEAPQNTLKKDVHLSVSKKQYSKSGVIFSYPASWGELTDDSKAINWNDPPNNKVYSDSFLLTMLPLKATNKAIPEVYFHKPTKTLAYTENIGKKQILSIINSNGKVIKVDSVCNDKVECSSFFHMNISPRANLLFVINSNSMEGARTVIYDLHTLKPVKFDSSLSLFSVQNDIYFSKDSNKLAIHLPNNVLTGIEESIFIQDPKTHHMKSIYSIPFDERESATKKYGDAAMVTLANIAFGKNEQLRFSKVVTRDKAMKDRVEISEYMYDFSKKKVIKQ